MQIFLLFTCNNGDDCFHRSFWSRHNFINILIRDMDRLPSRSSSWFSSILGPNTKALTGSAKIGCSWGCLRQLVSSQANLELRTTTHHHHHYHRHGPASCSGVPRRDRRRRWQRSPPRHRCRRSSCTLRTKKMYTEDNFKWYAFVNVYFITQLVWLVEEEEENACHRSGIGPLVVHSVSRNLQQSSHTEVEREIR